MSTNKLIPRLIRLRDIPTYLGMDRNRFNHEVRPYITEIPIGKQWIALETYLATRKQDGVNGWRSARKRAALHVRVHDLKHTFGRRLRAVGVSLLKTEASSHAKVTQANFGKVAEGTVIV